MLLQKGSKGDEVKNLQSRLIELGYICGTGTADGIYGNGTYNSVKDTYPYSIRWRMKADLLCIPDWRNLRLRMYCSSSLRKIFSSFVLVRFGINKVSFLI